MYKIRIYEQISSTQLRLIEDVKAGAAEHPVMYLALRQSAGIGSNGRRWEDASAAEKGADGVEGANNSSPTTPKTEASGDTAKTAEINPLRTPPISQPSARSYDSAATDAVDGTDAENNSSPTTKKTEASGDTATVADNAAKITENNPLRTPSISQPSARSYDSADADSADNAIVNTDAENNSSPATQKTEASGDTAKTAENNPLRTPPKTQPSARSYADFPLAALPPLGTRNLFLSFTHRAGSDVNAHNASIFYASLIARVLKSRGSKVFVKWPNDFYIGGKKVGGLLTYKRKDLNIVGVGLNFAAAPKYAGVLDISVHLEEFLPLLAAELRRQTSWREIFNEYALSFHKNSEFVLKIGEKTLQMRDARLCSDGSIIIGGERIYGNR